MYVLRCVDDSYYAGSTRNIIKRLQEHSQGKVKYTKSKLPIQLIFLKYFNNYRNAFEFEKRVKSWKKRKSIEKMLKKEDNIANKFCGIV